ncbi:MAG: biotin-dependent carboxyltransferase family protein [Propionivibrio sp.]
MSGAPALLEVVNGGFGNSIQDAGRFGFRHMGITVSGCLDRQLARCANALVGGDEANACIEIRAIGPTFAVREGRVRVALAGELSATVRPHRGTMTPLQAWNSATLNTGDVLEVGKLAGGTAYLAVSGGIATSLQLGSRSTYQRALIGGVDGRRLTAGNLLPCASIDENDAVEYQAPPFLHPDGSIHVMLGPQDGHFQPAAIAALLNSEYRVTPQLDRMGARLEGAPLVHISPEAADIVSDGVTPGVIQVPGNGQPIILLADCQTVGGYPKIATVISADLPRLGQLRPGQTLRFAAVDARQAGRALDERDAQWAGWLAMVTRGVPDTDAPDDDEFIWIPL